MTKKNEFSSCGRRYAIYLIVVVDISLEVTPSADAYVGLAVGKAANPILQRRVLLGRSNIDNLALPVDDDCASDGIFSFLAGIVPGHLSILHVIWRPLYFFGV